MDAKNRVKKGLGKLGWCMSKDANPNIPNHVKASSRGPLS